MPSPFPGMDPYMETYWDDVHVSLCTEIRTALQPHLPKGLRARAAQSVRLETGDEEPSPGNRFEGDTVLIEAVPAAELERWVQIIDTARGDRIVTVIEVLSPGNKAAGGLNKRYRRKL